MAQPLFPYLRSGSQMSMRSASMCIVSSEQYMLLFHSIGTFKSSWFIASIIVWRLGVGSPPTKLMFNTPSFLRLFIMSASCLELTGVPLNGSCDMSQFWQNTHLKVQELKNIVPDPPCPTSGGSSPK